ncbi:MAG: RhuM family protein, partial [Lonepinella koalarum]|nr:RhuM family protein [Lonepinella koalarum]
MGVLNETFWLTQKNMAELFGVEVPAISKHLDNIYQSGELEQSLTVSKMEIVRQEGSRMVKRKVDFYNLDAIIAVGYRVNSREATQFRIWATNTLREFIIKGFVLDDKRLKQGKHFGQDYFEQLVEKNSVSFKTALSKVILTVSWKRRIKSNLNNTSGRILQKFPQNRPLVCLILVFLS